MTIRIVLITVPATEKGDEIANTLVQEKLAACVNILPSITSIYWWGGVVQRDKEALLLVKTEASKLESLSEKIKEIHPYSVPEIVALPPDFVSEPYEKWIKESVEV